LLTDGVDINAWDDGGHTALSLATQHGFVPSVKLLLDRKADPNKADRDSGWRPITYAAFYGYDRVAAMLIDAGADVNATNEDGDRALLHAVFRGQTHIVKLLLERGADFRPANSKGYTPLMAAEHRRYADIAKILKSAGAKE
jgi:ankyrin repeat protein